MAVARQGFVHLRVRSAYSLLEGAIKADAVAPLAASDGMAAVALTDRANLFGALEFSVITKDHGVQPTEKLPGPGRYQSGLRMSEHHLYPRIHLKHRHDIPESRPGRHRSEHERGNIRGGCFRGSEAGDSGGNPTAAGMALWLLRNDRDAGLLFGVGSLRL